MKFGSEKSLVDLIEAIEDDGFNLREQGASIERYVRNQIETHLRQALLEVKAPNNAQVILNTASAQDPKERRFDLWINGEKSTRQLVLEKPEPKTELTESNTDRMIIAFHEIGHNMLDNALFSHTRENKLVSIIPGVTKIGGKYIYYAGVAKSKNTHSMRYDEGYVLAHIAGLLAGEVAETLVTTTGSHDAGKRNDIERATELAQKAILYWGLSEKWGRVAAPEDIDLTHYIASLSAPRKAIYDKEIGRFLNEGRAIAKAILLENKSSLIQLGIDLAIKGEIDGDTLDAFYKRNPIKIPDSADLEKKAPKNARSGKVFIPTFKTQLISEISMPAQLADPNQIVTERKKSEQSIVQLDSSLVATQESTPGCAGIFSPTQKATKGNRKKSAS